MRAFHIRRLLSRPRVCIFCGRPPTAKNREHVIPKWLIQHTGDPTRTITLGPLISQHFIDGQSDLFKSFSFDSFTFPSCESCNSRFSELEARSRPLLSALLAARSLGSSDFDTILDWFDKVRVGLWLAFHYFLDRNYWGIAPHFFISDRLATADRCLRIYRAKSYQPGIRFAGVNTPAFAHTPSCFSLIVNEWFFLNISSHMILSEAAGLPYPVSFQFGPDEKVHAKLEQGKERLAHPLLPFTQPKAAILIGQPILPELHGSPRLMDLYQSRYVSAMTLRAPRGIVLLDKGGQVLRYPDTPTSEWCPPTLGEYSDILHRNARETLQRQNQLIALLVISPSLSPEQRQFMEKQNANCIKVNVKLLELLTGSKAQKPV